MLGDLGNRLDFVMKSRVACCPTVSLNWEEFLCVISFATTVSIFFLCLCAWAKWSGTNPMMMCLLWRYDCTILMTCNDKSDVLYFLMSSFCQRSVYSLSCWVCVFLPGYFVRDSEWRREIIPISVYLSCLNRSSFSLAISMILCCLVGILVPLGAS